MPRGLLPIALIALTTAAAADTVERRGREPALTGQVTAIDDAGVTVRSDLGAVHVVPWDRVRRVETAATTEPRLDERLAAATDLWRARSRVERGDTALAEPKLERLFESLRGRTHETALVVAEGLLRCRLARADHVLAVVPALEVARLRRAKVTTSSYALLDPVYDEETALCPGLPPAWRQTDRLEALAHDLATYDAQDDRVIAALAGLYRTAVTQALGRPGEQGSAEAPPGHPGVELMELLVACGGSPDAQAGARTQLARRLPALPGWREAWARYFLGRSLLASGTRREREEGLLHLIHVPARFERTQPYLGALALADAASALDRDGDAEAAGRIRGVLERTYPYLAAQGDHE